MPQDSLQFEDVPPMSVPFRFFVTAPLYLLLIAALLLWRGPEALASRFAPAALAATHLFTLGFMSMVMIGATLQMLPVVAATPIRRPRLIANVVWSGLNIGTLALAAGFLSGSAWCFGVASVALAAAFLVFIPSALVALWRSAVRTPTVRTMRFALLALVVTVVLGLQLAMRQHPSLAPAGAALPGLHPGWGLLGWLGLLTAGVAFQVVPMFQITPPYPALLRKFLAAAIVALLVVWSIASLQGGAGELARACQALLALAYLSFALATLALQRRSRQRVPDVTLAFWRAGMGALAAALALWLISLFSSFPSAADADVLIGMLALYGFAASVINGMLYKIMPFIVWFHLQAQTAGGRHLPNLKTVLGEPHQRLQFRFSMAALALLVAAGAWAPALIYLAAFAMASSALLLGANMMRMLRTYSRTLSAYGAAGDRKSQPLPTSTRE